MPPAERPPVARVSLSPTENAVVCYLRLHPKVAATYGIKRANGNTSAGSMLLQLLEAQGADIKYHGQVPNSAVTDESTSNERAAAYIQKIATRPGARKKPLSERPSVMPTDKAAILKTNHGRLQRLSFGLLVSLSKNKRPAKFTGCGNRVGPPAAVALVERQCLTDFVEKKLRCACGARLRLSKTGSEQVAACAKWVFCCERDHKLEMRTSRLLHGDDYELNSRLNYAIVTCALSFARMLPFFHVLGMQPLSTTDHYNFKREVEPILADMAECSMCEAHSASMRAGDTDYVTIDGGYTSPRNAHGCTMAAHAHGGKIVDIVHKRLTDVGAKSSRSLELLCYLALLARPVIAIYDTVVMDGCRELVEPTLAAGKRAQADLWHIGKNWAKWFVLAVKELCSRKRKVAAAALPPNPSIPEVKLDAARQSKVEKYKRPPQGHDELKHVRASVRRLGVEPPTELGVSDLKKLFGKLARRVVMTAQERAQDIQREAYITEKNRRQTTSKAAGNARDEATAARRSALSWARDLRSMINYMAEYTLSLRGKINPRTKAVWTDDERGAEFLEKRRKGCIALILGRRDDETLILLNHPVTQVVGAAGVERRTDWKPPGDGFVKPDSFLFRILDSAISDPTWNNKFPGLIDARKTNQNESFFHTLRKWGTKHSHFARYYSISMWCSLLNWNENITREAVDHEWKTSKAGQLRTSAGRAYRVPIKPPPTGQWRIDGWGNYLTWAHKKQPTRVEPVRSYFLGWYGINPPQRERTRQVVVPTRMDASRPDGDDNARCVQCTKCGKWRDVSGLSAVDVAKLPQEFTCAHANTTCEAAEEEWEEGDWVYDGGDTKKEVNKMSVDELRAELVSLGLPDAGKKPELVKALREAREDPSTARQANAITLARRVLPAHGLQAHSPTRGAAREGSIVRPDYGLASPYRLPTPQRQVRRAPPKGREKFTAKRVAKAREARARGEEPERLKRLCTEEQAAAAALPMAVAAVSDSEEDGEEEEGEEEEGEEEEEEDEEMGEQEEED